MTLEQERPPAEKSIWRNWRTWAVVMAITIALAVLSLVHEYVTWYAAGRPSLGPRSIFWKALPVRLLHVPLVPTVWYLANRFRLDRGHRVRSAIVHVAAAIVLTYLRIIVGGLIGAAVGLPGPQLSGVSALTLYQSGLLVTTYFVWYWAIVAIFYTFTFYSESQARLRIAAQLQSSLIEARLGALRSQLNPHFLFNTLNTVSVLALKGEREAVVDVLERLSHLLRLALDDRRPDNISLEQEMEFIDGYLEIQRIRFADRLTIRREIAPDALHALVPAMILQPIVENAIKHGVSATSGPSTVSIEARRDGDMLRLLVSDTGPGFKATAARTGPKGIGLSTTEARLEELYGGGQHVEYGDGVNGGASVTIVIPFSQAAASASAA